MARGPWRSRLLVPMAIAILVAQAAYVAPAVAADPTPPPPPEATAVPPLATPEPVEVLESPAPSAIPSAIPAPIPAPTAAPTATPSATPSATPVPKDPAPAPGTIGLLEPLPTGATEDVAKRTETSRTYRDASGGTVARERKMDRHNNKIGRSLAQGINYWNYVSWETQTKRLCREALSSGRLWIISKSKLMTSLFRPMPDSGSGRYQ